MESMYSRVTTESFNLLAHQRKRLSNIILRDGFFPRVRNFFTSDPMWSLCIVNSEKIRPGAFF